MPQNKIKTITVKEAALNIDQWLPHAPYKNRNTHKNESAMLYNHEPVAVQVGTAANPVFCPFGASRWNGSEGRFSTVKNPYELGWAYQEAAQSQYQRAKPSGKMQAQLTCHNWDTEGTQGYYFYKWVCGLIDQAVKGFSEGVPDLDHRDENGQPRIVQAINAENLPASVEERNTIFRQMLGDGPIRPSGGEFPPSIKCKIRYNVEPDQAGNDCLTLGASVVNCDDNKVSPKGKELDLLKERCRGAWIVKVNPMQFKKKEITLTIDVIKVLIKPPASRYDDVDFIEEADAEMSEVTSTQAIPIEVVQ